MTLDRIALETKIPRRHLDALERGDFRALPPGFYQRSEVRAYAQVVGLDQAQVLTRFDAASQPLPDDSATAQRTNAPSSSRLPSRPRAHLPALRPIELPIVGLAGAAFSMLFWLSMPGGARPLERTSHPSPTPPVRQSPAPPAVADVPSDAVSTADTGTPAALDAETKLVVTTRPAGARVTIDGIGWGISPVTIRYLPPGDKVVRVTLDGHTAQQRIVPLAGGQSRSLLITLPANE